MAKKKVKDEYPFPGSLFTVKELEYINYASKMFPWAIDYNTATINVPISQADLSSENLTVSHLVEKFGFTVQTHIDYPEKVRDVFDPEFLSKNPRIIKSAVLAEKAMEIKIGDVFNETRTPVKSVVKIKGESSDKKSWKIQYLDTLKDDAFISKISAEISVNTRLWIPLTY